MINTEPSLMRNLRFLQVSGARNLRMTGETGMLENEIDTAPDAATKGISRTPTSD